MNENDENLNTITTLRQKDTTPALFANVCNINLNHSGHNKLATGANFEGRKISQKQLSKLMQFILTNIGDGLERGELVARYYKLPRRYCGHFTDPCYRGKEKREYEKRFRRAQPAVTKALQRLHKRGFIKLHQHGQVVKKVYLTPTGQALALILKNM